MRSLESSFLVPNGSILALLIFLLFALLLLGAVYALIRTAVRNGVDEALRLNRHWMQPERDRQPDDRP